MKCKNTEKHPYWWRKPEYVTPKYVSLTYWFELNPIKKEQKQKKFSLPSSFLSKALLFCCQSCPTLCDPMNRSTPDLPVHHKIPEFTQTRVHLVGDAIQPSHPLLSPSPPALNLSQHQDLFQWVSSSNEVAKVLGFQLQHQSFQCIPGRTGWISLQSKGLSRVFSNTIVQKHQFLYAQLCL